MEVASALDTLELFGVVRAWMRFQAGLPGARVLILSIGRRGRQGRRRAYLEAAGAAFARIQEC